MKPPLRNKNLFRSLTSFIESNTECLAITHVIISTTGNGLQANLSVIGNWQHNTSYAQMLKITFEMMLDY